MADPELSSSLRELGEKVLLALNIIKMPIASYEWKYQPSLDQYQLIIRRHGSGKRVLIRPGVRLRMH